MLFLFLAGILNRQSGGWEAIQLAKQLKHPPNTGSHVYQTAHSANVHVTAATSRVTSAHHRILCWSIIDGCGRFLARWWAKSDALRYMWQSQVENEH